jgi:2-polyprenyl-6-methoxyphenol hydroxylase-like FAD-dependent oxidoreductase
MEHHRIAILGAGPIGLEAALAAADHGLDFVVYEAGDEPAGSVADWGHVRLFTPWSLTLSPRQRRHLAAAGQALPADDGCPTGDELRRRALLPLAALPAVAPRLRLGTRVLGVGRQGLLKHEEIANAARAARPFRLLLAGPGGEERVATADLVLDCTGTWGHPNPLGDGGIPAPGERASASRITHRIPDLAREREAWAGRTVLLAGAGHSAQTAARAFAALAAEAPGTRVVWALRDEHPDWGAVAGDTLPERAALTGAAAALAGGASPAVEARRGVAVERLRPTGERVAVALRGEDGRVDEVMVDRIVALCGAVGDHSLYRELQVHECYATCGPINLSAALLGAAAGDCLQQTSHGVETLRNPEPGFYILGAKSYGRNNTFLLRTGWAQVEEVFAAIVPAAAA